jgi:hypothetical protein
MRNRGVTARQAEFVKENSGFHLQFQNPVLESRLFYEIRNYFSSDAGVYVGAPGLQTLHTRE